MMEPLKGWVVLQRPDCGIRASTCYCTHDVCVLYLHSFEDVASVLAWWLGTISLLQVSLVQQLRTHVR